MEATVKQKFFLILFGIIASQLVAHDLYLQAKPFVLPQPGQAKIVMFLAEAFPGKQERWRSEKTAGFKVVGPQGESSIEQKEKSDPEIRLSEEGTYVIGWSSTPSYISIEAESFNEYIEAEGYDNVVEMRKASGQDTQGREKYTRYLKAFLQAGRKSTSNFSSPLGTKIEIIPSDNPYEIKQGSELRFRVLFDGKPLADKSVMATFDSYSTQHDVYAQTVRTDSEGLAIIKITKTGIWMIRTNVMLPLKNDPQADWESFWANISFMVR